MGKEVSVSLVQSSPVLFDLKSSIDKIESILDQVECRNKDLILFPEAFLPAYPRGLHFGAPVGSRSDEGRDLWLRYNQNALRLESTEMTRIKKAVKNNGAFVVLGVIEKDEVSDGTLYCTMLYFDQVGNLIGKHRKLKPTAAERIIWGEGDGSTLSTFDTVIGKLGGLICWENYMPLARMAMYHKGVEIYLAPTADQRDSWQATMRHIACEGRCFVLGCNQFVTKSSYPQDLPGIKDLENSSEILSHGGSVIVDPMGNIVSGPLFDEEGIVTASLDMELIAKSKMDFDPIGHYNRPDVFDLKIDKMPEIKSVPQV